MGIKSTQIGVGTMSEPEVLEPRFPQQVWFPFPGFSQGLWAQEEPRAGTAPEGLWGGGEGEMWNEAPHT